MAQRDPYEILGVDRKATAQDIKSAYKKLTRRHHPDLNPGDAGAVERFKEVAAAYEIVSDPEKRRRFDAGEIDASGQERPEQRYYRDYAGAGASPFGGAGARGHASDADLEEILARAFGGGGGFSGARRARPGAGPGDQPFQGADLRYSLQIGFLEAAKGASRMITLPDGRNLKLTIPEGAEDGQILRLKGQGMPGFNSGPAGDAYVELHIAPHPHFERRGDEIHLELPVTLQEAVLGAKVQVPTIDGPVTLSVPKGSGSGRTLRLRDKGVRNRQTGRRGHQFVTLKLVLPEGEEPELAEFLQGWKPQNRQNPRKEMLT